MNLYKHQLDIINDDPKRCGLFLGTGSGKSLIALSLAQGRTLIICPKILRDDKTWQRNLEKLEKKLDITVLSKEEFRREWEKLEKFDTVIFDEVHTMTGVNPAIRWKNKKAYPKSSQIFDACFLYIQKYHPERIYLCTATPIRNPMAVYGLGLLLDKAWDFFEFRSIYYAPVRMNFREIWMPKKDYTSQQRLGRTIQKLGYTGKLSDWMDIPEQTHKIINVPLTKEQQAKLKELPLEFPDPLVLVGKKHQVEQGVLKGNEFEPSQVFDTGKLEVIEDLYEEFGKVLVFAKYTEQIGLIKNHFEKNVPVFVLDGQTKDRGAVIAFAEAAERCIVIAQSSVSAGYELPSFRCTIYASESFSYVDHAQSLGRTLRINNLQKNLYVYLVSGEIDKAVRKALETKNDFNEAIYAKVI